MWTGLVLLLALGIALFPVVRQWETLRWIKQRGHYRTEPGFLSKSLSPPLSKWLEGHLGEQWLAPMEVVKQVGLYGNEVTVADMKRLHLLDKLEILEIEVDVSDAALEQAVEFKDLNTLILERTKVEESRLSSVKRFRLETLYIRNCEVAEAGLAHLQEIAGLRVLDLSNTNVTDASLVHLRNIKLLDTLYLMSTNVTDAGLPHLLECSNLTGLDIRADGVTEMGVMQLKGLPKLKEVSIGDIKISGAKIKELKRALPGLKVYR